MTQLVFSSRHWWWWWCWWRCLLIFSSCCSTARSAPHCLQLITKCSLSNLANDLLHTWLLPARADTWDILKTHCFIVHLWLFVSYSLDWISFRYKALHQKPSETVAWCIVHQYYTMQAAQWLPQICDVVIAYVEWLTDVCVMMMMMIDDWWWWWFMIHDSWWRGRFRHRILVCVCFTTSRALISWAWLCAVVINLKLRRRACHIWQVCCWLFCSLFSTS